jgi:hypothetical protein
MQLRLSIRKWDQNDEEKVYFDDIEMTFQFEFEIGKPFPISSKQIFQSSV